MESKKRLPGWVGPSYVSRVRRFDAQRTINYYIELDDLGEGKDGEPAVLIGTPGLNPLQTVGPGPIRGLYTISNTQVSVIVSGNTVWYITGANALPVQVIGNLATQEGTVSIADNGIEVVIVDGQFGYYITIDTTNHTLNQITDPNFYPSSVVTFQDGYLIFNQVGTTSFFLSDLYAITFPALNVENKTGSSDILISLISYNRQLILFGSRSMEIWADTGASGSSPFQRQDGRNSQIGCAAPQSISVLQDTIFWLGSNAQGGGIVYS